MISKHRPRILGKYRLEELLSGGSFGDVYRAALDGPGGFSKTVAVKVVRPEALAGAGGVEALFREARTAALLNHRNVVQVFEVAAEDEVPYLVMEHVDGVDLHHLGLHCSASMPLWLRVGVALEICRGRATP